MAIRVVEVGDAGGMADCWAVRRVVFVEEQGVSVEIEMDAYDAEAVHLLASGPDGEPLGTVRFLYGAVARKKYGANGVRAGIDDDVTAVLGRLAVVRAARGTGLGATLVRAVEAEAVRLGLTGIHLEAQTHALGFYERLGYEALGPEFDEGGGIPHRAMRKVL
jgi:predicted GNAT family N-acyltransferase